MRLLLCIPRRLQLRSSSPSRFTTYKEYSSVYPAGRNMGDYTPRTDMSKGVHFTKGGNGRAGIPPSCRVLGRGVFLRATTWDEGTVLRGCILSSEEGRDVRLYHARGSFQRGMAS